MYQQKKSVRNNWSTNTVLFLYVFIGIHFVYTFFWEIINIVTSICSVSSLLTCVQLLSLIVIKLVIFFYGSDLAAACGRPAEVEPIRVGMGEVTHVAPPHSAARSFSDCQYVSIRQRVWQQGTVGSVLQFKMKVVLGKLFE